MRRLCCNEVMFYAEMWHKGSKPVACRFLDIELEAQIGGERGSRVGNSSIQLVSVNLSYVEKLYPDFNVACSIRYRMKPFTAKNTFRRMKW